MTINLDKSMGVAPEKAKKERELLESQIAQHKKEIAEMNAKFKKIENQVKGLRSK